MQGLVFLQHPSLSTHQDFILPGLQLELYNCMETLQKPETPSAFSFILLVLSVSHSTPLFSDFMETWNLLFLLLFFPRLLVLSLAQRIASFPLIKLSWLPWASPLIPRKQCQTRDSPQVLCVCRILVHSCSIDYLPTYLMKKSWDLTHAPQPSPETPSLPSKIPGCNWHQPLHLPLSLTPIQGPSLFLC